MSRLYGIRDPVSIGKSTTFKLDKMKIKWRALKHLHPLHIYLYAYWISILAFRKVKEKMWLPMAMTRKLAVAAWLQLLNHHRNRTYWPLGIEDSLLWTVLWLLTASPRIFHLIRWQNNTTLPSLICKSTPCTSQHRFTHYVYVYICVFCTAKNCSDFQIGRCGVDKKRLI